MNAISQDQTVEVGPAEPHVTIPGTDTTVVLVKDWREGFKWISTWCWGLASIIQGAWLGIPEDMKMSIPGSWVTAVAVLLGVLGLIGRFIDQPFIRKTETTPE